MVNIATSRKKLSPNLQIPLTTIICDASSSSDDIYNPKMDWCNTLYINYGHNMTFNFDYTLPRYNVYCATHKANRSGSNGFLPDVYQIWDEVIWLTPEKGSLISSTPIYLEQIAKTE